ncbi:MAG: hypothetical protein VB089_20825 [Anaerolineaceae bacterium]|jgi:hypothetical protein|nr:hypothetical protein [Anaerolineaceae bacterium]
MAAYPLVLITDTNIWIDLDYGGLLEFVFQLPYQICAADFAKVEMRDINTALLERRGLHFQGLDGKLVNELYRLRQQKNTIAVADMAAFLLAREQRAILVTGDRTLTKFASLEGIRVHGVLWLMDEMVRCEILPQLQAAVSLDLMIRHGARLPEEECTRRRRHWSV